MSGHGKTQKEKSMASKENKNVKKVISVKRRLRQPNIIKSKLGCKVSSAEIGKKHSKKCYRKNSTKKTLSRHIEPRSISEKSTNRTSERGVFKNVLTRKDSGDKLNSRLRPDLQNKVPDKEKSSKTKISIKCLKDINKNGGSNIPIFVRFDNTGEEKRYKSKFRRPTSANKLNRLRENLWQKSSYHRRFLGKSPLVKSEKTENSKSETIICKKKRSPRIEGETNFQQSQVKNSTDGNVTAEKKNLVLNKPPNEGDLGIKEEHEAIPEMTPLDLNKLSEDDVSTIDERYMKFLLSVANSGNKSERVEFEYQRKDVCTKATRADNKTNNTGKVFFVIKMKDKKNALELNSKNDENDNASFESDGKEKSDSASVLRETIKSEINIKYSKKKIPDAKIRESKNKAKTAYSKCEMDGDEQKKKTRNIVKDKKQNIEIPFLSGELKNEEVQELWKRENSSNQRISRSSDSSSTTAGNVSDQNAKSLGMESYQLLKQFVAEEVYRITSKYNKSELPKMVTEKENRGKICKEENVALSEKQISSLVRKKLAVKSKGNLVQGEKLLRNGKSLKTAIPLRAAKVRSLKSELKFPEERKNQVKKVPGEVIKNWSIVNRLEQAFLALGTPNFPNGRDPATPNGKNTRAIPKIVGDVKKAEKKIKEGKKNEIKPATRTTFNKQKFDEINKLSEKQLRVIHKMQSTSSYRKPNTASSESSAHSPKIEDKMKPQEENFRLRRQTKPTTKPTTKFTNNKSGIKPPTPVELLCSSWNKIIASEQIGKAGKKNSRRNHLCESSTQNKRKSDLERKKTFQVIPLKDSVIMQPRRSQSCNKIDRNVELDKKCSLPPVGNADCKTLTFLNEKNQIFSEAVKETGESNAEDCKNETEVDVEEAPALEGSDSKNVGRMSEKSRNNSGENVPKIQITADKDEKCVQTLPPQEISEQAEVTIERNHGGKTRAIKKRSILSIRTNQHENQTSRSNISDVEEERPAMMFQKDTSDLSKTDDGKDTVKISVFLSPTEFKQTPCTSLSSFDLEASESSLENSTQKIFNGDELKVRKAPPISTSQSIQEAASETSYGSKGKSNIRNAPWEEDINYYRALVKEIMSQYKRLDGFLKQSENAKALQEDLEELTPNEDEVLKENVSIQEYRKKIILEYQEVPMLEYKTKMEGIQKKLGHRRKGRNLRVVQPMNGEMDLDVKDYEPEMRTVLDSHIYCYKKNVKKSREMSANSTEKNFSLQEVNLYGNGKSKNRFDATCPAKSFIRSMDENKPEEKCRNVDFHCLLSAPNF